MSAESTPLECSAPPNLEYVATTLSGMSPRAPNALRAAMNSTLAIATPTEASLSTSLK
jgi:hypothetical protein